MAEIQYKIILKFGKNKNKIMNIGIIGQGFVGNAVYQKFKNYYDVLTYDLEYSLVTFKETIE